MQPPPPPPRQIDGWQDAEINAATWMRHWGFVGAVAKPGGSDGGVDVYARDAIAQVKYQGAPIGRPALQNLVGADMARGRRLMFFSGSTYAGPAVDYANQMRIALFRYDPWGRMQPVNFHAHSVVREAEQRATMVNPSGSGAPHPLVTPSPYFIPTKRPFTAHLEKHWAAWVCGALIIAPFGSLGDRSVYTGPFAMDALKFSGIFLGLWTVALLFLLIHAMQHGYGGARIAALRDRLDVVWKHLKT